MKSQFEFDLERGRKNEELLEQRLQALGLLTENTQHLNCYPNYDIRASGTTAHTESTKHITSTYEVKSNDAGHRLGNVVVELFKVVDEKKVPCGLSLTESNYYVFKAKADPNFYLIRTQFLKHLIQKKKYDNYIVDRNNYHLAIFSFKSLQPHFIIL